MSYTYLLRGAGTLAASLLLSGATSHRCIDRPTEDFLRAAARFGDRELLVAHSGGRVVTTPDTGIAREIATVGVTRFEVPFDFYVQRALRGDLYRTGPTLLQLGRFSRTPSLEDLRGLSLDSDDLDPLADVDPEAARSEAAAKRFLVRLVDGYQAHGIRSLETVRPGSGRPVLSSEVRALLENSPYLRHHGTHLADYVANYPLVAAYGAQEYFAWAKVNIGLKRLVRLTKVTVWSWSKGGRREAVVVTEQVFASRYFQASLQVDHLIADDADPRAPAVYLITTNRGRCDLLDSLPVRLLRPLILSRTRASTERTLDSAKLTLEGEYRRHPIPSRHWITSPNTM
jgi:hypothetical protein